MKKIFLVFLFVLLIPGSGWAQATGFTFQGRLNDGTAPANGQYDLQFRLFDSMIGGSPIGALQSRPNTVLVNGVFSVTLDFGAAAFSGSGAIFIEIGVRPGGSPNAFTILGPRQQLTVVPLALRAASAANADQAANAQNAVNAANATSAGTAGNALSFGGFTLGSFPRFGAVNTGDLNITGNIGSSGTLSSTGNLVVGGNAIQPAASNGFVKAMVEVVHTPQGGPNIRCYNGLTAATGPNCGFVVTQPLTGVVRIDFGTLVTTRFVSVSVKYSDSSATNNNGVNYRPFGTTAIEVFTFVIDSADTSPRDFTLILY